jgi:hypothetical protein
MKNYNNSNNNGEKEKDIISESKINSIPNDYSLK